MGRGGQAGRAGKGGGASGGVTMQSAERDITKAYLALSGGERNRRVLLADIRAKTGLTRDDFDTVARKMQEDGKAVLMGMDNMAERTKHVESGAIHFGQYPRHIMYLR